MGPLAASLKASPNVGHRRGEALATGALRRPMIATQPAWRPQPSPRHGRPQPRDHRAPPPSSRWRNKESTHPRALDTPLRVTEHLGSASRTQKLPETNYHRDIHRSYSRSGHMTRLEQERSRQTHGVTEDMRRRCRALDRPRSLARAAAVDRELRPISPLQLLGIAPTRSARARCVAETRRRHALGVERRHRCYATHAE